MSDSSRIGGAAVGAGVLLVLGAVALAWWDLSERFRQSETERAARSDSIEAQSAEIRRLEAAIQALRIENKSSAKGVYGVIEQIDHWAGILGTLGRSDAGYLEAEEGMGAALRAMSTHGEDAFGAIYETLLEAPGNTLMNEKVHIDERRRWLLAAAIQADPERGAELAVRYLRAHDAELQPTPRMRWLAADQLIDLDRTRAAAELQRILETESARGIDPTQALGAVPASRSMAGFYNFISRYVRAETDEKRVADTLAGILGQPEHDMVTHQECVKVLGDLRAQKAVPFIERAYESPTEIAGNGIFKNHCVNALVAIQGAAACDWLQDQATRETDPIVLANIRGKITELGCVK